MLKGGRVRAAQRDATRARLVAAAVDTLIAHGYAGTSTVAVQRAAGASRGALLHHFPTRGALVEALVEELVSRNEAVVEAALTAAPVGGPDVERAIGALHQALTSDSFQAELELWAVARTDAEVRAALTAAERRSRRDLGRVVDAAFGTAAAWPGYPLVAELTVNLLRGLAVAQPLRSSGEASRQLLDAWASAAVTLLDTESPGRAP
jgi:AcrR family transcriptional regulator